MAANLRHSRVGGNPATLITDCLDIWTSADTAKKSGRGRSSGNAASVYGIRKLRELILDIAVRGKLVPQNPKDEPASELLKKIQAEKRMLIKSGKIKKDKQLLGIAEEEKPFETPAGWLWVRLEEIADVIRGVTYGKSDASDNPLPNYVPLLRGNNIDRNLNFERPVFVPKRLLNEGQFVKKGDIVIAMSSGSADLVGKAAQATEDFSGGFGAFCGVVRPFSEDLFSFSGFFFQTPLYRIRAAGHGKGIGINNLQKTVLQTLEVPLPPLAEQHRIVAKVDELMALCDQLEAHHNNAAEAHEKIVSLLLETLTQSTDAKAFTKNWQRIATYFDTLFTTETSIDALKQTLLQLAVMGKLVPQDASDEPASELLKHIKVKKAELVAEGKIKKDKPLTAIDKSPFKLPPNWTWARFPEIGEFGRGKSKHRPRNDPRLFNPGVYPLVQTGEVARAGNLITEYHSKYSDIGLAQSKMWPTGTMCITIAANIADSAILGFDACFPDSVVGFVPYAPLNDSRYFLSFMKTARENLLKFAPATAQKNINLEILESVLIPLPPLKEISRIVAKVDELMVLCEQLKARITAANQLQQKLADSALDSVRD